MPEILIIEDDADFRKTLSALLRDRFPRVSLMEAEDGERGLEHLDTCRPDLVLTDIRLPGQNGFQITRRIRDMHPDVPILVLTSYHDPEYQEAAFSAGATHFASKHKTSAEEMLSLVRSILFGR
ncbi:MAG: response regulator [Thermodesulfobacteriota bacterium]